MSKPAKNSAITDEPFAESDKNWLFLAPMFYDFENPRMWNLQDNYFDPRITERALFGFYEGDVVSAEQDQSTPQSPEDENVPPAVMPQSAPRTSKETPGKPSFANAVQLLLGKSSQKPIAAPLLPRSNVSPIRVIAFDAAPTPSASDIPGTIPATITVSETTAYCTTAPQPSPDIMPAGLPAVLPVTYVDAPRLDQIEASDDSVVEFPVTRVYVPIETPDDPCSPSRPIICEPVAGHPAAKLADAGPDDEGTSQAAVPAEHAASPIAFMQALLADQGQAFVTLQSDTPLRAPTNHAEHTLPKDPVHAIEEQGSAFKLLSPAATDAVGSVLMFGRALSSASSVVRGTWSPVVGRSSVTSESGSQSKVPSTGKRRVVTITPARSPGELQSCVSPRGSSNCPQQICVPNQVHVTDTIGPGQLEALLAGLTIATADPTPQVSATEVNTTVAVASVESTLANSKPLKQSRFLKVAQSTHPAQMLKASAPKPIDSSANVKNAMSIAHQTATDKIASSAKDGVTAVSPSTKAVHVSRANRFRSITAKFVNKLTSEADTGVNQSRGVAPSKLASVPANNDVDHKATKPLPKPFLRARRVSQDETAMKAAISATTAAPTLQPPHTPSMPSVNLAKPAAAVKFVAAAESVSRFEHGDLREGIKDGIAERPRPTQLAPFHLHTSDRAKLRSRRSSATLTDCQHASTLKQALSTCAEADAGISASASPTSGSQMRHANLAEMVLQQSCSPTGVSRHVLCTPKPASTAIVPRAIVGHPPVASRHAHRSASMEPTLRVATSNETPKAHPSKSIIPASASKIISDRKVAPTPTFSIAESTASSRKAAYTIVKPFHLATDERAKVHARAESEAGTTSIPAGAAAAKIESLLQAASAVQTAGTSAIHASFKAKALAAFRAKGSFAPHKTSGDNPADTAPARSAVHAPTVPHSPALATKMRSHQRSESVTRQGSARSTSALRV